jgi:alkylated DNA repair dioxygenase AlkB
MENTKALDKILTNLRRLKSDEIIYLIQSLQGLLQHKTTEVEVEVDVEVEVEVPIPGAKPVVDSSLYQLSTQSGLDEALLQSVHEHVKRLKYQSSSNSPNSPDIHLYGEQPYGYNKQSAAVKPTQCKKGTKMHNLLTAVNSKLNTKFNSILINKYKDMRSNLAPHKDDEKCLDPASPITTLSFGACRMLQIYVDPEQKTPAKDVALADRSLFTMLPGFQEVYRHGIAAGNDAVHGMRFSVTFRRLLPVSAPKTPPPLLAAPPTAQPKTPLPLPPPSAAPTAQPKTPPLLPIPPPSVAPTPQFPRTTRLVPDSLVFGSSLVKNLNSGLMSKYTSKFKVFCKRGAHVKDIRKLVEQAHHDPLIPSDKVTNVFLLCGGNDIANLGRGNLALEPLFEDMEELVVLIEQVFPSAKINFISIIPRRAVYRSHIRKMHAVNDWIRSFCYKNNIRFVDIFTFYLTKTTREWWLNKELFGRDNLHFNKIGDSVLAKVLIGVANRPQP